MADEQAQVEEPTFEDIEEQTTVEEDNGSEVETQEGNTSDTTGRGDLNVALHKEREKWNDPEQIAKRAKELGIAPEESQYGETQPPQTQYIEPNDDISRRVAYEIDKSKAFEKYPELRTDQDLQYMVTGLINKGLSPLKAADRAFANIKKMAEGLSKQEQEEAKATSETQNRARSVESVTAKTSDDSEYERVLKDSKSLDPRIQNKAMIELLKLKEDRKNK